MATTDAAPLLGGASVSKEKAAEMRKEALGNLDSQIDSVNSFAVVATLLFGVSIQEFSAFEPSAFEDSVVLGRVYAVLAALSVGGSLFCSMISVFVVATVQRMKGWDVKVWEDKLATKESEEAFKNNPNESLAYVSAMLFPMTPDQVLDAWKSGEPVSKMGLGFMIRGPRSRMGVAYHLFPITCVLFVVAVVLRVLKDAEMVTHIAAGATLLGPVLVSFVLTFQSVSIMSH